MRHEYRRPGSACPARRVAMPEMQPNLQKLFKHCVDIETAEDIDEVMLEWIREAYHLR